jgi:hypothetical protein
MWQWVLTTIVLSGAIVYAVIRIAKALRKTTKPAPECDGCSCDCNGCPISPD